MTNKTLTTIVTFRSVSYTHLDVYKRQVKEDDKWRIRNNLEIDELLNHEDIGRFLKVQRIQWLGHPERMYDHCMPKKILRVQV